MTIAHPDMTRTRTLFCGRGNGGSEPPRYTRRKYGTFDLEGPSARTLAVVGTSFRSYWSECVMWHFKRGELTTTDLAVAMVLAEYSNDAMKEVWPSQETIGAAIGRSASTVNRSLRRMRALGLVEWAHRFLRPEKGLPRATTNLYHFRLSDVWAEEELPKRLAATNKAKGRRAQPSGLTRTNGRVTGRKKLSAAIPDQVRQYAQMARYATVQDAIDALREEQFPDGYVAGRDLAKDTRTAWLYFGRAIE